MNAKNTTGPRMWSLILNGPNNGCIAALGDPWAHCPSHKERVTIMEVPGGFDPSSLTSTPKPEVPALAAPALAAPAAKEPTKIIVNEPVDDLARSLGIVYNDMVPSNAGWFVPGFQRGYPSAADAIRGLFAVLKQTGLSRAVIEALPDHAQPSLF